MFRLLETTNHAAECPQKIFFLNRQTRAKSCHIILLLSALFDSIPTLARERRPTRDA